MNRKVPKQILLLGGKPIIVHVLERIDLIDEISEIIIPTPKDFTDEIKRIVTDRDFNKEIICIEGGETRQESTYRALLHATNEDVIIHEAVRPFVTRGEFIEIIKCADENVIYGTDIPFTVLEGKEYVEKNLKREFLVNVQLPHKYKKDKLLAAHKKADQEELHFTEDSSLFFHYYNEKIKILEGTEYNIKITKPIDTKIGEIIYKEYILGEE